MHQPCFARFNMGDTKPVSTPLTCLFLIFKEQSPQMKEERELMAMIPYTSTIESLMYAMVYMRPDIGHAMVYICTLAKER